MRLTLFVSLLVTFCVSVIARRPYAHCQATRIPVELLQTQVNVVYTMNRGCQICFEEAYTLPSLKREMAMRGVEINTIVGLNRAPRRMGSPGHSTTILPSVITDYGRVWSALGKENGHVFILDKCGRLIYQVIAPWALFMYPYVKAAILSTQHDNPCGPCTMPLETLKSDAATQETQYPAMRPARPINDLIIARDGTVPLRVIFTKRHTHAGSSAEYHLVELQTGNPSYHGHPDLDKSSYFDLTPTSTVNEEQRRIAVIGRSTSTVRHAPQTGRFDVEFDKSDSVAEGDSEEIEEGVGGESDEKSEEKEKLKEHYGSLLNWLQYV